MSASSDAYNWLEQQEEGLYERLIAHVLDVNGVLVQAADFVLAFKAEAGCAYVIFAYGNLRRIVKFARQNASVWGCDRVSWERSMVGKHRKINIYNINKLHLCQKEQDLV